MGLSCQIPSEDTTHWHCNTHLRPELCLACPVSNGCPNCLQALPLSCELSSSFTATSQAQTHIPIATPAPSTPCNPFCNTHSPPHPLTTPTSGLSSASLALCAMGDPTASRPFSFELSLSCPPQPPLEPKHTYPLQHTNPVPWQPPPATCNTHLRPELRFACPVSNGCPDSFQALQLSCELC